MSWKNILLVVLSLLVLTPSDKSKSTVFSPPAQAQTKDKPKDPVPVTPPYLKLPATKTAKANRYFCLRPDSNCKSIKWIVPAGIDSIDSDIQLKDPSAGVFIGDTGTYQIGAYGALGDQATDISYCTVTIGSVPPGPGPGPGPTNPLTATLQAAYGLDADSDKAASLQFLQLAYKGMAASAGATYPAANWALIKTLGDAVSIMASVIEAPGVGLPADSKVVNLRKAIMADLEKTFGTVSTTPVTLTALASWLNNVSTALAGVK